MKAERFKWTFHNLVGHPVSEILHILGFLYWSNRFHEWTLPVEKEVREAARGGDDG